MKIVIAKPDTTILKIDGTHNPVPAVGTALFINKEYYIVDFVIFDYDDDTIYVRADVEKAKEL